MWLLVFLLLIAYFFYRKRTNQRKQTSQRKQSKPIYVSGFNTLSADKYHKLEKLCHNLVESVDNLMQRSEFDTSEPSDGDKVIYLPIEANYNSRFFTRMYLLRYHTIKAQIVSVFDMIQYQIPVKATNEELILLIYGTHFMEEINDVENLIQPFGDSKCLDTDKLIMKYCPTLRAYRQFFDYVNQEMEVHTAKEALKLYQEAYVARNNLNSWIKQNFKKASQEFQCSGYKNVVWTSEFRLFSYVKIIFPDAEYQFQPEWLDQQSLDIYIPSIRTAVEYQGEQHYRPLDYFGGDENFLEIVENDRIKKEKCAEHSVTLIEWPYSDKILFTKVLALFDIPAETGKKFLSNGVPCPVSQIFLVDRNPTERRMREIKKAAEREAMKEKLSPYVIRKYSPEGVYIEEYNSLNQAAQSNDANISGIAKCINGERRTSHGLIWKKELRETPSQNITVPIKDRSTPNLGLSKKVIQIDPATGEVLHEFASINKAAESAGISTKGIYSVIKGYQKTAGGYFWQLTE